MRHDFSFEGHLIEIDSIDSHIIRSQMARKENMFADGRKMHDNRDALHPLHAGLMNQVNKILTEKNSDQRSKKVFLRFDPVAFPQKAFGFDPAKEF
jgi:hypothetical protein